MSHLTQSMVEQFFELEKESARGVLLKEMDSAMDTIFKQMKRKLMQLVDNVELGNETEHGLAHLGGTVDHRQQLSNDTSHIPSASTNSHDQFNDMKASNLSLQDRVHHQQLYTSSNQIPSTSTESRAPDNANLNQGEEIVVKIEPDQFVNIIKNESIPSSSNQSQPSNEQSNHYLFDEFDDEDCDCSECVGDLFAVKEEADDQDDNDNHNSQSAEDLMDESNNTISRQTKRPRFENNQIQNQAQPNNQNIHNQYITISLKCSQCLQMFQERDTLNAHLKSVHSIEKYRCLYKDCNQSFDKPTHLNQSNTTWPCGYCSGQYKSSNALYKHYLVQHEEGLFQCPYADCQFVAELKQTVHNHFGTSHKDFVCQYPGCAKRYPKAAFLKTHQLTHLTAKPYRCKLPNCDYASVYKHTVLIHIRKHLQTINPNWFTSNSHDPNDYLEVIHELL